MDLNNLIGSKRLLDHSGAKNAEADIEVYIDKLLWIDSKE